MTRVSTESGLSRVRNTIASRPHVASCIGRTGEVQWLGAYAWPGIVVKAGPFRGKEGRGGYFLAMTTDDLMNAGQGERRREARLIVIALEARVARVMGLSGLF